MPSRDLTTQARRKEGETKKQKVDKTGPRETQKKKGRSEKPDCAAPSTPRESQIGKSDSFCLIPKGKIFKKWGLERYIFPRQSLEGNGVVLP